METSRGISGSAPRPSSSHSPTVLLPKCSHLLLPSHWAQLCPGLEEWIGREEKMLGFWMQATDCKWVTPEIQREKK